MFQTNKNAPRSTPQPLEAAKDPTADKLVDRLYLYVLICVAYKITQGQKYIHIRARTQEGERGTQRGLDRGKRRRGVTREIGECESQKCVSARSRALGVCVRARPSVCVCRCFCICYPHSVVASQRGIGCLVR